MSKLTYEKVLDILIKSSEKFDEKLEKSQKAWEKRFNEGLEKSRKEFDKRMDESDKKFAQKLEESDKKFTQKLEESDRKFTQKLEESDRKFNKIVEESEIRFTKKINKLEGLFTSQWGKLLEAIVEPSALKLFQQRGYDITFSMRRGKSKNKGRNVEYDVILSSGDYVIIVEVKTTCRVIDIKEFTESLIEVPEFMKHYKGLKVLGAVAALDYDSDCDKYAEKNGIFVIKTKGDGFLEITNGSNFKPKVFVGAEMWVS